VALVEIESFADPAIADMAHGRLAVDGIDSVLFGAGLASLGFGVIAPVRLMVEARDRVRAERLLADPAGPR
jgi:hypothetical protein